MEVTILEEVLMEEVLIFFFGIWGFFLVLFIVFLIYVYYFELIDFLWVVYVCFSFYIYMGVIVFIGKVSF